MNDFIEKLSESLPPAFSRKVASVYLKGIISAKYLANLDSRGEGPGGVLIGKKIWLYT